MEKELDKFHYHEALHLAHVFGEVVSTHLYQHPVIQKHVELKTKLDIALSLIADVYQGIPVLEESNKEK